MKQTNFVTKEDDERNNIVGGIAVDRLRSLIERIERLEEEKKVFKVIFVMFLPKQNPQALMLRLCVPC